MKKNLGYLLQALLNPLQKNPAMGPRVLAKRLIIVQCKRNGEGEPEREKEVTATMTTIVMIAKMTTMTTMTDRGTKTADQSSAGMGSEQGRMSDRGGTAGTAGRGLTTVLQGVTTISS